MGDHELEEGEACDDPDSIYDPDTAFSYLDEKLSMVLGDMQKAFQGVVSNENLGGKHSIEEIVQQLNQVTVLEQWAGRSVLRRSKRNMSRQNAEL